MNKGQLETELKTLSKKYNSLYARVEVLKLKTANRNEILIHNKKLELIELQTKVDDIKKRLGLLAVK